MIHNYLISRYMYMLHVTSYILTKILTDFVYTLHMVSFNTTLQLLKVNQRFIKICLIYVIPYVDDFAM